MVASGDWLIPRFNGDYRFEKPVLTYWLIGASYTIFGVNEFAARLPSALAALGAVLLACLLAGRIAGSGAGLIAGVILTTCLQFVALGRTCLTDMHLTFFLTAGLVLFYLGLDSERKEPARRYLLGAWAACALAVLTKGPVGLLLPAAIAGAYLLARPDRNAGLRKIPFISGIILFLTISLPWYVAITLASDFEFFRVFILQHNVQRYFGEVAAGGQHVEPFFYYLSVLLAGIYPWSFFVLQALLYPLVSAVRELRNNRSVGDHRLFPLLWALGVLLFFSLSRAKLPTYITPAFPAVAVLLAVYLGDVKERMSCKPKLALILPALLGLVFALALAAYLAFQAGNAVEFPLGILPFY
ncbi:MAG TPA: glycosyltransferase family 39 protein, partial [Candidatus Glassbacteria bacterium]|nr:glycosyltransferase family 39 protein [Candidatus Glassbacteria bacterium]